MESKDFEIDGIKFQTYPINPLLALRLDKQLVTLLLPAFKGMEGLDSQINLGKITEALSESLSNLENDNYEKFILEIFCKTIAIPKGKEPVQIDKTSFDSIFVGNLSMIYKLLWEVMKYNKFTPFVVAGGGIGMLGTLFSKIPTGLKNESGMKLEKSGN